MNFQGKNNFAMRLILEFDLLTPRRELLTCSRSNNEDLFVAAIGGFGMLGCFTRIVIQMKMVHSGLLSVLTFATKNSGELIEEFESRRKPGDYLIAWIDFFARGKILGRGLVKDSYLMTHSVKESISRTPS